MSISYCPTWAKIVTQCADKNKLAEKNILVHWHGTKLRDTVSGGGV